MTLSKCPVSGLMLPTEFIDGKQSLKKSIDSLLERVVEDHQHLKGTYFLSLHMRFNRNDPSTFEMSRPVITKKLPPFMSNQFVFWISNDKGICELLWMVSKKDGKLKVDFNQEGVAFLQAKGAMPS